METKPIYYWHVIRTKNKIEVVKRKTSDCIKIKNSVSCFTKREFAVSQANNTELK